MTLSAIFKQLENLELVFKRLEGANLKLNPKMCILFQKEVAFLGHVINENGVGTDPKKVQSIHDWPTPRNTRGQKFHFSG
jgi:hypothetical protein